jgi:hypothetical protein
MPEEQEMIRVQLNYPISQVKRPILYELVRDYGLIPNIRRANMDVQTGGYIFLELTGEHHAINRALLWLEAIGVEAEAIGMDGTQGWAR